MIKVIKTYVCDFCDKEVVQEFKLATINTEMHKLSQMDIPKGWLIHSDGKLICDNIHVELE